jgi:hypothetical protein
MSNIATPNNAEHQDDTVDVIVATNCTYVRIENRGPPLINFRPLLPAKKSSSRVVCLSRHLEHKGVVSHEAVEAV